MDRVVERILEQFPEVPETSIEDLFERLHSARAVVSLLSRDTTDLSECEGGTPLEPADRPLPPATRLKLFGFSVEIHVPPHDLTRLLRDSNRYLRAMNRPRACQWLASQDHSGKPYDAILEGFVSAGTRHGRSDRYVSDCLAFLQCAFPTATKDSIDRRFRQFRWDLFDAAANLIEHPPRKQTTKPRPKPELLVLTSPYASYLAQKCLALDPPALLREDVAVSWRLAADEAERTGCVFECTCCFEDVPFEKLVQCPRGHLFCRDCLERNAGTLIGEGRAFVACLSVGADCDCEVSVLELERVLPRAMLEKLTQTETLNAVLGVPLENLVKCHACGMPSIYERCKRNHLFKCPTCNAETCLKCGMIAHPGLTCRQLQSDDPATLIAAKMNDALIRICPNCHAQFMKEVGCNRMECPRCRTWFCYYCRKLIPKDVGYAHFWKGKGKIPPGACPLFINNRQFNRAVVQERKAMIEGLFGARGNGIEPPEVDDNGNEEDEEEDEDEEEEAADK